MEHTNKKGLLTALGCYVLWGLAPIILGITTPCFALQRTSTTNYLVQHMHGHCRIRYTF